MGRQCIAILSAGFGLLSLSLPSFAHHGTSIVYALTSSITISGTVTDFRFVNPHVLIHVEVTAENGEVVDWLGGMASHTTLTRNEDWDRDTLKPGDQVSVSGAPARGGAPSVWVQQVILNGEPLIRGDYSG